VAFHLRPLLSLEEEQCLLFQPLKVLLTRVALLSLEEEQCLLFQPLKVLLTRVALLWREVVCAS
jgi:hypothetical protein